MAVKKISDLLPGHSPSVICHNKSQFSILHISADPDLSLLPLDINPMEKRILHKRLEDQPWNITAVCFLGNIILHLEASLIAKILKMDIIFQNVNLICHRKKASLFIDACLKEFHKIPDQSCQFLLTF